MPVPETGRIVRQRYDRRRDRVESKPVQILLEPLAHVGVANFPEFDHVRKVGRQLDQLGTAGKRKPVNRAGRGVISVAT